MFGSGYKKIEKKLNQILDNDLGEKNTAHTESEITVVEKKYNIAFPVEYKWFVLRYGNCYIKDNMYYKPIEKSPWTPDDGFDSIGFFYGLEKDGNNLIKMIDVYSGRISESYIPIADCDGGNQLCIGVKGSLQGKVYFWDHESDNILGDGDSKGLYLVAESFTDFIMGFQLHKRISNVNVDDIEVWLDDDLLND